MTKTELRKEWEARVAAYKASGQSASAWCAANNLKPRQLWYWLRKHKNIETAPAVKPSQWLSVEVSELKPNSAQGSALLVRVGQATVEVKPGFNPALLSDVVRILAELC
jgi:transposase-like protein